MNIFIGIIGVIASLLIFFIQESRRKKYESEAKLFREKFESLEERNRTDIWHLYRFSFRLFAKSDRLKTKLEDETNKNSNSDIAKHLGKIGDIHGGIREMCMDLIRLIKNTEPLFNEKTIEEWRKMNKIPTEYHKSLFLNLVNK